MSRIADFRVVLGRDDVLTVAIEGRPVIGLPATNDLAVVLAALARAIEGAAWSTARSALDEATSPASVLFGTGAP